MSRIRFRRLAHTADVRLAVWGDSEDDLFRNAVSGALACALGRPPGGTVRRWRTIEAWPDETAARLVRSVNEALFLLYTRREVAVDLRLDTGGAALGVAPLVAGRTPAAEVKAATFHDLAIIRRPRLRAVLTLDL